MTVTAGSAARPHESYRHEALLYRGLDGFLDGTTAFIRDGVAAGQPVMVAVPRPKIGHLRKRLGADADRVDFVDMTVLGANPARIIPAWAEFVETRAVAGQPVRGVGEPVWAGRRAAEVVEAQLHESLLNLAIDPDTPLWLRCPYDLDDLDDMVLAEAHRSHPALVRETSYYGSSTYGGAHHAAGVFDGQLPQPAVVTDTLAFDHLGLRSVRNVVTDRATATGISAARAGDLVLAVHELANNSLRHGGGRGVLRVWHEADALVCEVRDAGRVEDPLVGRRAPGLRRQGGRGVWIANQLCDLVQLRSSELGTTVRVLTWL